MRNLAADPKNITAPNHRPIAVDDHFGVVHRFFGHHRFVGKELRECITPDHVEPHFAVLHFSNSGELRFGTCMKINNALRIGRGHFGKKLVDDRKDSGFVVGFLGKNGK